ncbi:hypothetical protein B0I37DRAFT_231636 [Chaetomium sp. MPI-CAGE-AT-0009]|nr:hypothetical protein B0I37DRAFT_231636 [Chaetomium sp. MPI-CAGE-AT-0009]
MTSGGQPLTPQQPVSQHQQQQLQQLQQLQQHQQQRANGPNTPSTPVASPIQSAVSPPNKRDLKSWWKGFKLPSKHHESHDPRTHGIFGVPLRQSITYANVAISLVDEDGKSYIYGYVPIVVAKCGVFLKERATEIEGIFRLNGSEKRIKELKTIFDSPDRYGKGLVWDGYTVHDAANVLRRYLNDLPEPVVPLDLYEKFREPLSGATRPGAGDAEGPQFVEHFDMDAAIIRYQQLITELPPLNRQLLLYILDLLAVFAAKSDQNRMTSQNLAAIFQPGMLSHPNHAMAPEEYRLNQCVIIFLIENQDHFLIGMQGTAADEKTVEEVQKGTPVLKPPSTPVSKPSIVRSTSSASAGAESVAKDGSIRRNKSTSSRRSFHSNGCPSPASPALTATPTGGGLTRSNTLPSKKSPALQAGRFASRNDSHVAPMTPVAPPVNTVVSPPAVVEETVILSQEQEQASFSSHLGAKDREKLLEPLTPEATTPSKDKKRPILFPRIASGESDGRQPNKLRKKRLPGSANPSAHSSTVSLPHSTAVSTNTEAVSPLEAVSSVPQAAGARESVETHQPKMSSELTPRPSHAVPVNAESGHPGQTESSSAGPHTNPNSTTTGSNHTDALHAGHVHADTLHPSSAQVPLKSKKSPPTSLHSSFNEGSDLDQIDELATVPAEIPIPDTPSEKEKKKRWRLSRKKEDSSPPSFPSFGSPRPVMGSNATAGASGTSISSGGKLGQSMMDKSMTDMSDRTTINTEAPLVEVSSKESRDDSHKISNWIKNKYREHKENVEHRRNKSPPAGERTVSIGSSLMSSRGKSLDLKRGEEERPAAPQLVQAAPPQPAPLQPSQLQNVLPQPQPHAQAPVQHRVHSQVQSQVQPPVQPPAPSQLQPEVDGQIHPDVQPKVQPQDASQIQPNVQPQAQLQVQAQTAEPPVEPQAQAQVEPKDQAKDEPENQPQHQPHDQPQDQPKVEPQTQTQAPPQPQEPKAQ